MRRKLAKYLVICLTLMLALGIFPMFPAYSDPAEEIKMENLNYEFTSPPAGVGDKFNVDVYAYDIQHFHAFQVVLDYNATLLNCTNAWPTKILGVGWNNPSYVFYGVATGMTVWTHYDDKPTTGRSAELVGDLHSDPDGEIDITGTSALIARFELEILMEPPSYGEVSSLLSISSSWAGGTFYSTAASPGFPVFPTLTDSTYVNTSPLAPTEATVYVDPQSIVDPLLVPCSNFTINVDITDATDLYSFEFTLNFNQSIVKAVEATLGDFFPPVSPTVVIDNVAGYMDFSASLTSLPPKSGDGTLAVIKFHVESIGESDLHLSDVQLKDQADQLLPYEALDGYFNNVVLEGARIYVEPPEIIDPTLMPPQTFSINVTIDDVENMYGYEFRLGFNNEVLICIGVTVHVILGEPHYIPNLNIDNTMGIIWVNFTYYPPAVPATIYSPTAIATITFRLKALGSSVLDLFDTNLVDDTGQPIAHETEDGFVNTISLVQDVAVVNVTVSENVIYQGWTVDINVTVRNEGNLSETFDVNIYHGATLVGTHTVTDLANNTETAFTITWNTDDAQPCNNYTISAEIPPLPYEIDTADNVFEDGYVKIKIMGDITGDGVVNIADISVVMGAFGSYSGHPRWNPDADCNRDNKINILDAAETATNFGKTC